MNTRPVVVCCLCLLALIAPNTVYAETIRGAVIPVSVPHGEIPAGYTLDIAMEEIAPLVVVGDLRFIEGIRIEVQVPRAARALPGSLGMYLHRSLTPPPQPGIMTIRGERIFFLPVPTASRFFVTIPFRDAHAFRQTADTYVTTAIPADSLPLSLSLVPITKGITREVADARFTVAVEPIVVDRGALMVVIRAPDGELVTPDSEDSREFTLRLNGATLEYTDADRLLPTGLHRLVLESEKYETHEVTVGVERGRVQRVEFQLRLPRSVVRFDAPRGAEIFVNGETVAYEERTVSLTPGDHLLLFRVGEYTISRRLTVEPRKNYDISLGFNIVIQEN
ncbi:MAG: hypothetical protein EA403_13365 [Spirochaetaceae bacterium]|nr:MAG: hypothetical protein EA403_13365 [Spirochaetaceae bacterium]